MFSCIMIIWLIDHPKFVFKVSIIIIYLFHKSALQKVLKDFNLKVPRGTVVALVGLSGGGNSFSRFMSYLSCHTFMYMLHLVISISLFIGKSTVAALLERFYDIDDGKISIDGVSLKELDPTWLRGKAIGFINQVSCGHITPQ